MLLVVPVRRAMELDMHIAFPSERKGLSGKDWLQSRGLKMAVVRWMSIINHWASLMSTAPKMRECVV